MLSHVAQYATTMIKRRAGLLALLAVVAAAPAEAQFLEAFEEDRWGVHLSYTPEWESPDPFRHFLGADGILDWRGNDFSVGFARGRARGGEWGLAYIRQRVAADSRICLSHDGAGGCFDPVQATGDLELRGLEFHWFTPFVRFADDRVQVGVNATAGAGWYQGTILRPEAGGEVDVADVLRFRRGESGKSSPIPIPMFRVELGVGAAVAPGLRLLASGGYGLPGARRIGVSLSYFPGGD